ncbi:conserved hypothetical protein [delta proteobacterium NaphS2]|nr:conserved hypothetical protein [delta proteobacterium NaphS2]
MALVRYRTRDLAAFLPGNCSWGTSLNPTPYTLSAIFDDGKWKGPAEDFGPCRLKISF